MDIKRKIITAITALSLVVMNIPVFATENQDTDTVDNDEIILLSVLTGTCGDDVYWELDTDTGVLTISGTGDMMNFTSYSEVPWFSSRNAVISAVIEDEVTSIGSYAFFGCDSLVNVAMNNNITNIGDYAFEYCSSLASIIIPDSCNVIGSHAFCECIALANVEMGSGLTDIGDAAFSLCTSLTDVVIPDGVTIIDEWTFYACSNLRNIAIPNSVESIGYSAFYRCSSLASITIPDSVTSVGSEVFYECSALTDVIIGCGLESISNSLFFNCNSLTNITFSDSVTNIGNYAFYYCSSLTDVYYYGTQDDWNNITIGTNNTPLTSATIHYLPTGQCGDNVIWALDTDTGTMTISGTGDMWNYDSLDFSGNELSEWDSNKFYIKTIFVEDSITSIGDGLLKDCENLTAIYVDKYYGSMDSSNWGADSAEIYWFPIPATELESTEISDITYTGEEQTPDMIVSYLDEILDSDSDYEIMYSDNINAGTATITLTGLCDDTTEYVSENSASLVTGKVEISFTIAPASLPNSNTEIDDIEAVTYKKKEQAVLPVIMIGDTVLIEGQDYELSYSNNINAGTGTVTITGIGNYSGEMTKDFTIKPKSGNMFIVIILDNWQ